MAMMEKAMYLKGLCDGLEPDKTTKEGKLIAALIDLVTEMAAEMDDMQSKMSDLEDYCDELDQDLGDVEEVLLDIDEDDEDEDDDDLDICDGDCSACKFDCGFDDDEDGNEDEDDEDEDDELYEIVCPSCGDIINFSASLDPEKLRCPGCGEKFACIVEEDDLKILDGDNDEE